jgi:hypothetical protein
MSNSASVLASLLKDFADTDGNEIMQAQASLKSPLWRELDKVEMDGEVGIINVVLSDDAGATNVADMGLRPAGIARVPVRGIMEPVYSTTTLTVGHGAKYQNSGTSRAADWLAGEIDVKTDGLAKKISQNLLLGSSGLIATIGAIVGQFSSGVATFTIPAKHGLVNNTAVELYDSSTDKCYLVRVGKIVRNGNSFDVTLINDIADASHTSNSNAVLAAITWANTDQIYARGSFDNVGNDATCAPANLGPVSLVDLAGAGAVYGISADNCSKYGFIGHTYTSVGDISHEKVSIRLSDVQANSGDLPSLAVCNPLQATALGFGALTPSTGVGSFMNGEAVGQTRKNIQAKLDKYGNSLFDDAGIAVSGIRLLKDANCPADTLFAFDKKFVKIGLWHGVELEKDDGGGEMLSQTRLQSQMAFTAMYNLMCRKRSAVVSMSGLETGFLA